MSCKSDITGEKTNFNKGGMTWIIFIKKTTMQ